MTYEVDELDLESLGDSEVEPILDAVNLLTREAEPRAIDLTVDEFRIFSSSPGMEQRRFLARSDSSAVVGIGSGRYPGDGTNPELLGCSIRVLPEHRRRGVGTMLLAQLADMAEELGRGLLQGFHFDTVPAGKAFAYAVGATDKLDFHENVLRIEDLDMSLMEGWASLGDERAPGYSIQLFEDSIPEAWFSDIAHLFFVLERDMPMAEDFEPRVWDADRYAEMQAHYLQGTDALSVLAIDDDSGTAVGMSQLMRRHTDPTTWNVTVTMVDPEHRGKSLGKWLKGTVNVAAVARWEGGVYQSTGNAFTNEPMLAINHAMGFEHELTITDCSVSLSDARAYLKNRT